MVNRTEVFADIVYKVCTPVSRNVRRLAVKKRRGILIGSTLGFLAVLLGELYCLLNFRGDVVMIAGVGLVLLIMAYLMLDAGFEYFEYYQELEESASQEHELSGNRKSADSSGQSLERIERELALLRKELSDLLKAEIQYERENTRALISHNKKKMEQLSGEMHKLQEKLEQGRGN